MLTTCVVVSGCLSSEAYYTGDWGADLQAINYNGCMTMVGFSCYAYEGIGVVMPIMQASAVPHKFEQILFAAFATLTVFYMTFSELCYVLLGSKLNKTFVTQELN